LYDHDKIWSLIIINNQREYLIISSRFYPETTQKQMEGSENPNKIEANLNFGMSTAK